MFTDEMAMAASFYRRQEQDADEYIDWASIDRVRRDNHKTGLSKQLVAQLKEFDKHD